MKCPAPGETCTSFRRVGPGWAPISGFTCDRYHCRCFVLRVALGGDRQSWCWSALLPLLTIISCVQMASSLICVTGAQLGPEPLCLAVMGQPQLQTWPWGFEDGRWETGPSSKGSLSANKGLQMGPASTWVCSIPGHSLGSLVCFFFFPSSSLSLFWSPGPHQVYSGLRVVSHQVHAGLSLWCLSP